MSDVLSGRFSNFRNYTVVMLTAGLLMMGLLVILGLMQFNSRLILQKTNKAEELNHISSLIGLTLNKVTLINRSAYRIVQENLDKNTTPHALEKLLRNSYDSSSFNQGFGKESIGTGEIKIPSTRCMPNFIRLHQTI